MGLPATPPVATATARTDGPEQTETLAAGLGRLLGTGDVVALIGDLGAGKTCFVRGLAQGAGCDPEVTVASPSFTIVNAYPGPLLLQHLDLYRLGSADELEMIGLRDMFERGALVVEWFDAFADEFPEERLEVRLGFDPDPEVRHLHFVAHGVRAVAMLEALGRTGLVDRLGEPPDR